MPNRILKESICTSDSIDSLSWFDEVLFYRLIVNCDDYGRFDGRVPVIKNRLFPLKENITAQSVKKSIDTLATVGLVELYTIEGKPFLQLPTWENHQTVRAKKSKYPPFDSDLISFENNCNQMKSNVTVIQSNPIQSNPNTESESNPSVCTPAHARGDTQTTLKRFVKPTIDQIREYCQDRNNSVDPEKFFYFYESKGWLVGKQPMKDWKACIRTWEKSENEIPKRDIPKVGELGNSFETDDFFEAALKRSIRNH